MDQFCGNIILFEDVAQELVAFDLVFNNNMIVLQDHSVKHFRLFDFYGNTFR
ncbi:hypothetical protein D3C83_146820 [compost metagenome]